MAASTATAPRESKWVSTAPGLGLRVPSHWEGNKAPRSSCSCFIQPGVQPSTLKQPDLLGYRHMDTPLPLVTQTSQRGEEMAA